MIAILLVVVGLCLIWGLPKQARSLSRVVLGLIVLVTAVPLVLSECPGLVRHRASAAASVDIPWGWLFFGVLAVLIGVAYFRFRARRDRLASHFKSPSTSLKRRVDR